MPRTACCAAGRQGQQAKAANCGGTARNVYGTQGKSRQNRHSSVPSALLQHEQRFCTEPNRSSMPGRSTAAEEQEAVHQSASVVEWDAQSGDLLGPLEEHAWSSVRR